MSGYIGTVPVPQATQTREAFTASANQTSFATIGYEPGFLDVFLNGVKLAAADYTATNAINVVLATGAAVNDILEIVAYKTFNVANTLAPNGSAANLTNLPAAQLTGALPAISGAALTGINTEPFKFAAVTGATPSLNVGTFNFFDNGTLTANTTVSFTSVPTNANWKYSSEIGAVTGTNWDVSTAVFSEFIDISAKETYPADLFFRPDGLKMYVLGKTGDDVTEYDLSLAWVLSTATYLQAFSISTQETAPTGLFFKPDGTKMYVIGSTSDNINEYNLSTAWNVSTASYLRLFSLSSYEESAQGVFFKPDGYKMYIIGNTRNNVNEYNLSTAWDVTSASFLQLFSVTPKDGNSKDVFFKSDGTKMYFIGDQNEVLFEYNLSTAWNVTTAVYSKEFDVSPRTTSPEGVFISPDGTRMFVTDANNPYLHSYRIGTPATVTLPAAVVGLQTSTALGNRVTYTFFTSNSGTTVNLIAEDKI